MNNVSQGHHLHSYFNRSTEVTKMNLSKELFDGLLCIGFFPTPSERIYKMSLQSTTHITKGNQLSCHIPSLPTSLSHIAMLPPFHLHGHQLQLFVLCLGFGSKSFNDQTQGYERHVHCNTATRTFSSRTDTRQHGVFSACRLSLATFGLVKHSGRAVK